MPKQTKNTNKKMQRFISLLLLIVIVSLAWKLIAANGDKPLSESRFSTISENLYSRSAVLVCLEDKSVLMQKESEEKIYPASMTKIMTTIVAIENIQNLKELIKLPDSMFQELYKADASMAGFKPGEKVRAVDLLYGAMLPSGAECCIGLAGHISGSEQDFVELMNEKASVLGLKNTRFENTTGLHDKNHYTTVSDMADLLCYALQNDTFREIFTSVHHACKPTNKNTDGITFRSTMFEKLKNPVIIDGKILGGKTGYTGEAGLCLASLAEVGGKEYVLVTAGAMGTHKSEQYNIIDALAVYNSLGKK